MTQDDKKRFAVVMATLGVAFDSEPSTTKMSIYFEALMSSSIESIEWAAKEAIKRLKYFPKVAELSELASIAPRMVNTPLAAKEEVKLLERITPPEEAKKNLAEMARRLNGTFGTSFQVGEENGRPTMQSTKGE